MMSKMIPTEYRHEVRNAMLGAAALGPLGAFTTVADVAAIAGVWGTLLVSIASKEGISMKKEDAVKICTSVALGMGGYYSGCKLASKMFHAIPVAGPFIAMGCSSVANYLLTYYFASAMIATFRAKDFRGVGDMALPVLKLFRGFSPLDLGDLVTILAD